MRSQSQPQLSYRSPDQDGRRAAKSSAGSQKLDVRLFASPVPPGRRGPKPKKGQPMAKLVTRLPGVLAPLDYAAPLGSSEVAT